MLSVVLAAVAGARVRGGLTGTVVKASNRPTCTEDRPCTVAAPGTTLAFVRGGSVVAHVVSGAAGAYTIELAPGTYTVRATVGGVAQRVVPAFVRVADAAMLHRQFTITPRVQVQVSGGRTTG